MNIGSQTKNIRMILEKNEYDKIIIEGIKRDETPKTEVF